MGFAGDEGGLVAKGVGCAKGWGLRRLPRPGRAGQERMRLGAPFMAFLCNFVRVLNCLVDA